MKEAEEEEGEEKVLHGFNSSAVCINVCEFYLNSNQYKKRTEKEEGGKKLNGWKEDDSSTQCCAASTTPTAATTAERETST